MALKKAVTRNVRKTNLTPVESQGNTVDDPDKPPIMTDEDKEDTDSLASDDVFDDKNPQLQSDNDSEDDQNMPPPN